MACPSSRSENHIIVGHLRWRCLRSPYHLVATAEKIKEQLDLVLLRESCRDAMKAAYDWKLMVYLGQVLGGSFGGKQWIGAWTILNTHWYSNLALGKL